jgi:hypothetical protein
LAGSRLVQKRNWAKQAKGFYLKKAENDFVHLDYGGFPSMAQNGKTRLRRRDSADRLYPAF